MLENSIKVFDYKGSKISFANGESVMVNATEMAKPFDKRPSDYLRLPSTNELIEAIVRKSHNSENQLVTTRQGSAINGGGTWMHEDVALEFARWLSPAFAVWCCLTKKFQKYLVVSKIVRIFATFTVNESHSFRRASGKVAQSRLGIFYALTLRYWRLPIRSYIQVLRGECINCEQRIWQPLSLYKVCL